MKPSIRTLGEILYSPSQYVIPVFQRNYRWERPQWDKLWQSLIEIQSPEKRGNHFMGFLVFVSDLAQPGQHTKFHLIDGQQRLTTSSIALTAVRNVARQLGQTDLADEIHQYYLVHPLKKGDQHFRLLPKERDHDAYLALVSGQGVPTGRMADALAYFEEQLSNHSSEEPEPRLRRVFDTVCQRLEFMCATLEAENAYNIFKSLNSTGVPLGPSDLIRNFVFMHVVPDEQDDFDRLLWSPLEDQLARPDGTLDEERFSRFCRDFLMAGGRYVQPKDTFPSFESRYEATNFSPTALATELNENVVHYAVISGQQPDESQAVTRSLAGLNVLESSTTYPLLLALFRKRAAGEINSGQIAQCVEMLRGFILRRFVCGESSRGYGQMFVRALAKDAGDPIATLEAYLLERGWPDDHQFQSAFVEFPLYQRGYTREVLETLERARGHKEPADLEAAQVEHVMPQTLRDSWVQALGPEADRIHADWLHRPGNLTLSAYNQELWNHPFDKKRERYKDSNIVITREIGSYPSWGEEEIRERGRQLAEEATGIWIGPKEQVARPEVDNGDDDSPGRRELRSRFWAGLNDYLAVQCPNLPRIDTRPSWAIRLPSGVRHVTFHLHFNLRHQHTGIEVDFWKEASQRVWERIRQSPQEYHALIGTEWSFEQVASGPRGRMSISRPAADLRDPSTWADVYQWLGEKLSLLYDQVAPKLRDEIDRSESA
jgi:hypothetical protein